MQNQNTVTLTVANPAANNQPIVYVGVSADLNITLNNSTGSDIQLTTSSLIQIFFPYYYSNTQIAAMGITGISQSGWTLNPNVSSGYLTLNYTGASGTWANGTPLSFTITDMLTSEAATSGQFQINLSGMTGTGIPPQLPLTLILNNPPVTTPATLSDVLQLNLDNQGSVFVSDSNDALSNTIYLNIANKTGNPLYQGSTMWSGSPKIIVTFVYGSTAGSLAQNDPSNRSAVGSAWGISGARYVDPNGWGVQDPPPTGGSNFPSWTITPDPNNMQLIGTGDLANETFKFDNIVSLTPVGYTQVYVQFTGFMQSENVVYNDEVFVLEIVKQTAPATRGLLSFFSPTFIVPISQPTAGITFELRWAMFYVNQVTLITNIPGVAPKPVPYNDPPPLYYDSLTVVIPGQITQDTPFFLTLQAFDGAGGFLNSMQFTIIIAANFFADLAGNIYPVVFLNNQLWMAANLKYPAANGSVPNPGGGVYGALYTLAAAMASAPDGWRLPTVAEYQGLITAMGNSPYTALMINGTSGFNAQLGGFGIPVQGSSNITYVGEGSTGNYWSSTADTDPTNPNTTFYLLLSSSTSTVNTGNAVSNNDYLAVRYVKNE